MQYGDARNTAEGLVKKHKLRHIAISQRIVYLEKIIKGDGIYYDMIRDGKRIESTEPYPLDQFFDEIKGLPEKIWHFTYIQTVLEDDPEVVVSVRTGFSVDVDDKTGICSILE